MNATPIKERTLEDVQGGSTIAIDFHGAHFEGVVKAKIFGVTERKSGVKLLTTEHGEVTIEGPPEHPVEVLAYRPHEYISSPQRVCKTCGVAKRHHAPMETDS